MGDSISEGVIEEFVKHPGEFVEADEIIARIETDKVTVDIAAPEQGIIKEYFAGEGDIVDVGADFYVLDLDGTPAAGSSSADASKPADPEPPKQAQTPTPQPPTQATPPPPTPAQQPS